MGCVFGPDGLWMSSDSLWDGGAAAPVGQSTGGSTQSVAGVL